MADEAVDRTLWDCPQPRGEEPAVPPPPEPESGPGYSMVVAAVLLVAWALSAIVLGFYMGCAS